MYAGENKTPDIDGKNNGSSLKYNQNCLDIAYKNAYGNASGKPTSSSDFKNYKCYMNGKVVPCTSMSEDGQTKKAEADYQEYADAITTTISGSQTIAYTDIINNTAASDHFGFANYIGYNNVTAMYGKQGRKGIVSLQCWEGTNPGCEVGIDTSQFKKFIDADLDNIVVTVSGVEYPLTERKVMGKYSKYYWTGSNGNDNVLDFSYHKDKPNRILFIEPTLLNVLRENNGKTVDFEVKIKGS